MMTIMEFATKVAEGMVNTRVEEVIKGNGVKMTGIVVKLEDLNVAPTIYVDGYYNKGMSVEETRAEVSRIAKEQEESLRQNRNDFEWMMDFKNVAGKITARLLNKANNVEVWKSVKKYGFDDLIIVPVIDVTLADGQKGTVKVTEKMLEKWGVTKTKVINQALRNSAETAKIQDMFEVTGNEMMVMDDEPRLVIITNEAQMYGAIGVITKMDYLKEKYGSFYVIPSSVHEVIIVPATGADGEKENIDRMVREVNSQCVERTEWLDNKCYLVA